jgi:hypothetical protein
VQGTQKSPAGILRCRPVLVPSDHGATRAFVRLKVHAGLYTLGGRIGVNAASLPLHFRLYTRFPEQRHNGLHVDPDSVSH